MLLLCGAQARKEQEQSKASEEPIRRCLRLGPRERRQRRANLSWREHEFLRRYCSSGPQVLGRGKDALPLLD